MFRLWSTAILSAGIIIFICSLFLFGTNTQRDSRVELNISPSIGTYKVGETVTVGVHFSGTAAERVRAANIQLKYDNKVLQLVELTPGQFFNEPLVLKKEKDGISLVTNPILEQTYNPSFSVVRAKFKVLKTSEKMEVGFDDSTQLYAQREGKGLYPQLGKGYYVTTAN